MNTPFRQIALRTLVASLSLLVASACVGPGTTRSPRLFVLHPTLAAPDAVGASNLSIGMGQLTIPDRLDRPQLVTRFSDNEVRLSEFEQWAEPLDENLQSVLTENLSRALGTDQIVTRPWGRSAKIDYQIQIDVIRFEAGPDDVVTLAARWQWTDAKGTAAGARRRTMVREPAAAGADAIVAAMSRAAGALAEEIAAALPR